MAMVLVAASLAKVQEPARKAADAARIRTHAEAFLRCQAQAEAVLERTASHRCPEPPSPGEADPATIPGGTSASKSRRGLGVSVFGTSRSGGAFNRYGQLPGDNYTIYIPTTLGTAVMQYADPASAGRPYAERLVDPEPLRVNLPDGLSPSRLVVACVLRRTGTLSDIKIMEAGPQPMTSKVVAALYSWKFTPALHGNQPVEVHALLGFNVDTR